MGTAGHDHEWLARGITPFGGWNTGKRQAKRLRAPASFPALCRSRAFGTTFLVGQSVALPRSARSHGAHETHEALRHHCKGSVSSEPCDLTACVHSDLDTIIGFFSTLGSSELRGAPAPPTRFSTRSAGRALTTSSPRI